jgi:hypothetical protein
MSYPNSLSTQVAWQALGVAAENVLSALPKGQKAFEKSLYGLMGQLMSTGRVFAQLDNITKGYINRAILNKTFRSVVTLLSKIKQGIEYSEEEINKLMAICEELSQFVPRSNPGG